MKSDPVLECLDYKLQRETTATQTPKQMIQKRIAYNVQESLKEERFDHEHLDHHAYSVLREQLDAKRQRRLQNDHPRIDYVSQKHNSVSWTHKRGLREFSQDVCYEFTCRHPTHRNVWGAHQKPVKIYYQVLAADDSAKQKVTTHVELFLSYCPVCKIEGDPYLTDGTQKLIVQEFVSHVLKIVNGLKYDTSFKPFKCVACIDQEENEWKRKLNQNALRELLEWTNPSDPGTNMSPDPSHLFVRNDRSKAERENIRVTVVYKRFNERY